MSSNPSQILYALSQKIQNSITLVVADLNELALALSQINSATILSMSDRDSMRIIFDYLVSVGSYEGICVLLFSKRFSKKLSSNWESVPSFHLGSLWQRLETLPLSHFERNEYIRLISIEDMDPSSGQGDYFPGNFQIVLSYRMFNDYPNDVVPLFLHEIGHSVRRKVMDEVMRSFFDSFGWRSCQDDDSGIDDWINLMGGWDNLNLSEQSQIRNCIRECLGPYPGTFTKCPPPQNLPSGHPWIGSKAKEVYDRTEDYWFEHLDNAFEHGDYVFFMNFYYKRLMVVNKSAVDFVYASGINKYALMGPEEFFAELYSDYYDPNTRMLLTGEIQDWFHTYIDIV